MIEYDVSTRSRIQFLDVTRLVEDAVYASKVRGGICVVYCPHTTAGITINEHADPDVVRDLGSALVRLVPSQGDYTHAEGNSDSHIKTSLVGPSQTLIIENGRLVIGQSQGVFFCEFDGPRERKLFVKVLSDVSE